MSDHAETHIVIATPHGGDVTPYWLDSFIELVKPIHADTGLPAWGRMTTVRLEVAVARNQLVHAFLKTPATHLLFWDDDVLAPLDGLIKLLEVEQPIVSGFYTTRAKPTKAVSYIRHKTKPHSYVPAVPPPDKIVKVDGIGAGFVLIERRVFETIESPWFEFICGKEPDTHRSEDFVFCEKAQAAGFDILLHGGVRCAHVGRYFFDDGDLPKTPKRGKKSSN